MNLSGYLNQKLKEEAKTLAKDFLSKGRTMRELQIYAEIIKEEAEYQVKNNTIYGLSNGKVV